MKAMDVWGLCAMKDGVTEFGGCDNRLIALKA